VKTVDAQILGEQQALKLRAT